MQKTFSKLVLVIFLLLKAQHSLLAQDICDENGIWNDKIKLLKIYTENDYWGWREATDRYFTNGIKIEYSFLPKKNFLRNIFLKLPPTTTRNVNYSSSLGMNMYTPENLNTTIVDRSDRPYAGWAYLAVKSISSEFITGERFTSEYSIGVIGPAAQQEPVQKWVHKITHATDPRGWDNQIKNDVALNANFTYEKQLLYPLPHFQLMGVIEGNLGTVTNYMGLGTVFRLGRFNDYFTNEYGFGVTKRKFNVITNTCKDRIKKTFYNESLRRNFSLFLHIKPVLRIMLDNSLLQGGLISFRNSPYVLKADRVTRLYANAEYGVTLQVWRIGLSYNQLFRTKEFDTGHESHWGSISLQIRFTRL